MKKITVDVPGQGLVNLTGELVSSELYWSKPSEVRTHLKGGQYSTAWVWKENYHEVWKFEGLPGTYRLNRIVTGKSGTWENCGEKFKETTTVFIDTDHDLYNHFDRVEED